MFLKSVYGHECWVRPDKIAALVKIPREHPPGMHAGRGDEIQFVTRIVIEGADKALDVSLSVAEVLEQMKVGRLNQTGLEHLAYLFGQIENHAREAGPGASVDRIAETSARIVAIAANGRQVLDAMRDRLST